MRHVLPTALSLGVAAALLAACSSGGGSGGGSQMEILRVSNGFGEILPHKTFRLGPNGEPTSELLAVRTEADLLTHVTAGNPILAGPFFSTQAILPGGAPGNHFLYAQFTKPIDITSVLTAQPGQLVNNSLTGTIVVTALNVTSGESRAIRGRVFVNGQTYAGTPSGDPLLLPLQTWVTLQDGVPVPVEVEGTFPGLGFPGTQALFAGVQDLVSPNTLVFVVDADGDLSTFETFPSGEQIRMRISTGVRSDSGQALRAAGVASTTVGEDVLLPQVLSSPPPTPVPAISPGGGDRDVDPLTSIRVEFTEPVQPWSVGSLPVRLVPSLSGSIELFFGPVTQRVQVPFSVMPASVFDLTTYELRPAFNFPGEGPSEFACGVFNKVDIAVSADVISDLSGNKTSNAVTTTFFTGEGPGLVNAPVAPDVVYATRGGAQVGISVIDLNGFGGGTGKPTYDPLHPVIEGNSNFPNNPNVLFQGSLLRPPLTAGSCTVNGGSAGVFTLTKDSSLNDMVVRSPLLLGAGDMMLGWALDRVFDNGPAPFGCQAGGGNLCASDGFKQIAVVVDGSTLSPGATNPTGIQVLIDNAPNIISWAPSPNPPPLVFPPLCIAPFIGGQEPTSVDSLGLGLTNLLVPGDPFGNPAQNVPPSGLLAAQPNNPWEGPSLPATNVNACSTYGLRQQVGHFLYIIDRARREISVLNSNRMTVVDRIQVPDPTSMAIGTNLDVLAVTNQQVNTVTFIDINPSSATFHQVIKTTAVGQAPRGIAWEPGNEDVLVCNEGSNTVSIISAFSLQVRRTVSAGLDRPFELAVLPRQVSFGYLRNVYFAWILNRNGKVSFFESGPNGVNGWGYDDIIGQTTTTFLNPKTLQPDPTDIGRAGVWIVHEGRIDIGTGEVAGPPTEGAISQLAITAGLTGMIFLGGNLNLLINPQLRDLELGVTASVGQNQLSGVPVDIAFDNLVNLGGIPNWVTAFSAGTAVTVNGKALMRPPGNATSAPRYLFAAVPTPLQGPGGIDVFQLSGALVRIDANAFQPGIQSIPAPGITGLMDYFRQ